MIQRPKRKIRIKRVILLSITVVLIVACLIFYLKIKEDNRRKHLLKIEEEKQQEIMKQEELTNDILNHYNKYVITNDIIDIYKLEGSQYIKSGSIGKSQTIELKELEVTYNDLYLPLETFDDYYVYYKDISKIDNIEEYDLRYKNYIPYNQNIITSDITNFYDLDNNLIYSFNNSFDLPIIVKENDKYGVEFNNRLLYVKKENIKDIQERSNTSLNNTDSIAVLNYHFFYDNSLESERKNCNQTICLSTQMFRTHLDYIKNNNIFTPTLEEFEMYLDEKIQLPKSVVITIDDGWRSEQGIAVLEEYELNATVFLITVYHETVPFLHTYKYVEYHSHGDNLHNQGDCPGGQGGAIKCKDREFLLNDLKVSSEKLDGSKYFCYPFYEYNDYSISILKEAGYRMAFAGGGKRAYIGVDKYRIPRFAIQYNETANDIAHYIGK